MPSLLLSQGLASKSSVRFTQEAPNLIRWVFVLNWGAWDAGRSPEERVAGTTRHPGSSRQRASSKRIPQSRAKPTSGLFRFNSADRQSVELLAEDYWNLITDSQRSTEIGLESRMLPLRSQGYLDMTSFLELARWKSTRPTPLYLRNTEAEVQNASRVAFKADSDTSALRALMALQGVGLRTATALLHWMIPERFPVFDFRVVEALGLQPPRDWNDIEFYLEVAETIRSLAGKYGLSLRTTDRALWTWSKRQAA